MRYSPKILRGKSKIYNKDYDFATEIDIKGKTHLQIKLIWNNNILTRAK